MEPTHYCHNPYHYQRRLSREVKVGRIGIGGANPIRVPVDADLRHDGHARMRAADA